MVNWTEAEWQAEAEWLGWTVEKFESMKYQRSKENAVQK
jgi:hypothetical protein